jgi:hypothetical protein
VSFYLVCQGSLIIITGIHNNLHNNTDVLKSTNQNTERAYDQRERHPNQQKIRVLTEQQQRYHQVFNISNYEEQKNINLCPAEGTCQWVLQSSENIRWLGSSHDDLLWVSADPGCGNSVLARSIIDDHLLASSPAVTICYFFFKDNDEQAGLDTALCSILHQLFDQRPHLLSYAITSWEKNGEALRYEADELWRILITATSSDASCQTICVFDALDACREIDQDQLIQKLQLFHRQICPPTQDTSLKFLVTSRPYNHIQDRFRAITDFFPHLHLKWEEEIDQVHRKIDLVVKMRVKELADTASLSWDIQQRPEQQLLQMEHRTYLWLHLAIDDIRPTFENSLRPAQGSIILIPSSVREAYKKILSRQVPSSQKSTMRKVFQIIVEAWRPLTITEMATALSLARSPQSRAAAQAGIDPRQLKILKWVTETEPFGIKDLDQEANTSNTTQEDVGFQLPGYENFIQGSFAYKNWLLSNIRQIGLLELGIPDLMFDIGAKVQSQLEAFSSPRKMSHRRPQSLTRMTFNLDWDPAQFIHDQDIHDERLAFAPNNLQNVLCLTGSWKNAQAATLVDYMGQTWPGTGQYIITLLKELICVPKGQECFCKLCNYVLRI